MTIYDSFTFFNEYDLLEVRLAEHDPFVDYFIIAEGDKTFSGEPHPHQLDLNDPRIAKYSHKIRYVRIALNEAPCDPWVNERIQRNALLEDTSFQANDIILLSDLDEIVSRHAWPTLLATVQQSGVIGIRMKTMYYYVNLQGNNVDLTKAKLFTGAHFCSLSSSADEIRQSKTKPTDEYCGWHFSYLGQTEFIIQKLNSFSHQEYNTSFYTSRSRIKSVVRKQRDLFGRKTKYHWVPMDESWPIKMQATDTWVEFICKKRPLLLQLIDNGRDRTSNVARRLYRAVNRLVPKAVKGKEH